jgi:hypothetical protein
MRRILRNSVFVLAVFMLGATSFAQNVSTDDLSGQDLSEQMNVISSAVPFLNISPESRGGAMGETGVATTPDVNSQAWNPSKYAFMNQQYGVTGSFTPWLRHLVSDINLYYLSGFYKLDKRQTISGAVRYFSVGTIIFKESAEGAEMPVKPSEYAVEGSYSRLLSKKFAGAVTFRYIHSDLSGGHSEEIKAGNSFASDVAFYYKTPMKVGKHKSDFAAGINISNIGAKISYDGGTNKEFIPTNLKLGACYTTELDKYNTLSFAVDLNKLLIPTPDTTSVSYASQTKDVSVVSGMFKSFGDAPGGMKEELHEIMISVGAEYWYNKQFALRAGYFHEHETKGNRKYITAGAGLKFNVFTIDASYIIPMEQNNPLANTIRFSLSFSPSEI